MLGLLSPSSLKQNTKLPNLCPTLKNNLLPHRIFHLFHPQGVSYNREFDHLLECPLIYQMFSKFEFR
ncbi:hypothetical protein QVD17_30361 [Tagetes erecta]|uniref:Uncharacterized protein n=1 Tax=Tagetes erecta TaxID=13708 RepID=A0AAD8K5H3_TARER|nr:hypothetical protein QVD17_30361 [Tagetes erecta]